MPSPASKMFADMISLKDAILKNLREAPKSISKLTRELSAAGMKHHKLIITGYLRALADLGYVEERDFAPSKVYSVAAPLRRDIYEQVRNKAQYLEPKATAQINLVIYTLQRIFRRAVFLQEVRRCGFTEEVTAPLADDQNRVEARKIVISSGLKLPKNDPAYMIPRHDDKYHNLSDRIIIELITDHFLIKKLVRTGTQTVLGSTDSACTSDTFI
jgi:hypothetical protein